MTSLSLLQLPHSNYESAHAAIGLAIKFTSTAHVCTLCHYNIMRLLAMCEVIFDLTDVYMSFRVAVSIHVAICICIARFQLSSQVRTG